MIEREKETWGMKMKWWWQSDHVSNIIIITMENSWKKTMWKFHQQQRCFHQLSATKKGKISSFFLLVFFPWKKITEIKFLGNLIRFFFIIWWKRNLKSKLFFTKKVMISFGILSLTPSMFFLWNQKKNVTHNNSYNLSF